jgi:cytochrome c5
MFILITILTGICITISSCKKTEFTNPSMVPWFDTHCSSCHKSGASNANDWKYDSKDFEKSISNNKDDLKKEVLTKQSMPPKGLTQTELDKFKTWFDAGCPSN